MFKLRRVTLIALAIVLTVPVTALAAPEDQPEAAAAAASWIADELAEPEPSFDMFGKTAARADVVYALASTGTEPAALRRALRELRAGAAEYIGDPGSVNVANLTKVVLAVAVSGGDLTTFVPGRSLEAELRSAIGPDGTFPGGAFVHSLAMNALAATPGGVPAAATDALTALQCDGGYFTWDTCENDPAGDVDTTAIALQALLAGGATAEAATASTWLAGAQDADGSWPNPFGDPNANSAGVAAQALRGAGETEAADLGADFVLSLQTDNGGIRFVAADTEPNGFATLQGILALGAAPYFELDAATFDDVAADHLFAREITWLGIEGTTQGCNPPDNTNFCPDDDVTRGQMAAFLVRALDLADPGTAEFTDTTESVFEDDIAKLATAGITRGCNPPDNTNFCPDDDVTRGEMAAFLVRALDLTDPGTAEFTDTTESVFEDDIAKLATAGITRGCNPPDNTNFCPDRSITRGEMAALLFRAMEG